MCDDVVMTGDYVTVYYYVAIQYLLIYISLILNSVNFSLCKCIKYIPVKILKYLPTYYDSGNEICSSGTLYKTFSDKIKTKKFST